MGRATLRLRAAHRSGSAQHLGLERRLVRDARSRRSHADRPPGAARDHARRPPRPRARVRARGQRLLDHVRRAARTESRRRRPHRVRRHPDREREPAVERRLHVGRGREGPAVHRDELPRHRCEHLVAEQGPRVRRAGPRDRHALHRPRPPHGRRQRAPTRHAARRRREDEDVPLARRQPDQQLRRQREHRALRFVRRNVRRRVRPARRRVLGARLRPRGREAPVRRGTALDRRVRALVRSLRVLRGRVQARPRAVPRHGAPELGHVRQRLPERLPRGATCRAPASG